MVSKPKRPTQALNRLHDRLIQTAVVGVSTSLGLVAVAFWFGGLSYGVELVCSLSSRLLIISALTGVTAGCLGPVRWPLAALCGGFAGIASGFTMALLAFGNI